MGVDTYRDVDREDLVGERSTLLMCWMNSRAPASMSTGIPGIDTVPKPPADETAAASFAVVKGPSPSCTMGCSMPASAV